MKKTKLTRSLLAACSIVALSAVMYGCVHSGDDPAPIDETDMEMPEPMPDPGPTDLEATQTAAADAATAAMTASTNADTAADGAEAATINIATLQTNGMARYLATSARSAANDAADAYAAAKAASAAAAAATTGAAAEEAWAMADAAKDAAEAAEATAVDMADAAIAAAMTELHIDGTVKTVGDSSVDASAELSSVTTGSDTVITGLIASMNPMGTSAAITGSPYVAATPDDLGTLLDERVGAPASSAYKQQADARTFAIGKTLDSSDDTARLMIVTHYPRTNMVRVFAEGDTTAVPLTGTKAGSISIDDTTTANVLETNNVPLRSEGMFVAAGDDVGLVFGDLIADDAEPVEVFSYVVPNDDTNTRVYATLRTTSTDAASDDVTYSYTAGADITAEAGGPDGPNDNDDTPDAAQVTVAIPGPVEYEHLHFGVWAELGAANAVGAQDVTGFGIGFVQRHRRRNDWVPTCRTPVQPTTAATGLPSFFRERGTIRWRWSTVLPRCQRISTKRPSLPRLLGWPR